MRAFCGGWVAAVEQGHYGHSARKATWLYAYGCDLPPLRYGASSATTLVSWCGNKIALPAPKRPMVGRGFREAPRGVYDERPRLSSREASRTPIEFRDLLLGMARSVVEMSGRMTSEARP